jgi:hypothetical protein
MLIWKHLERFQNNSYEKVTKGQRDMGFHICNCGHRYVFFKAILILLTKI